MADAPIHRDCGKPVRFVRASGKVKIYRCDVCGVEIVVATPKEFAVFFESDGRQATVNPHDPYETIDVCIREVMADATSRAGIALQGVAPREAVRADAAVKKAVEAQEAMLDELRLLLANDEPLFTLGPLAPQYPKALRDTLEFAKQGLESAWHPDAEDEIREARTPTGDQSKDLANRLFVPFLEQFLEIPRADRARLVQNGEAILRNALNDMDDCLRQRWPKPGAPQKPTPTKPAPRTHAVEATATQAALLPTLDWIARDLRAAGWCADMQLGFDDVGKSANILEAYEKVTECPPKKADHMVEGFGAIRILIEPDGARITSGRIGPPGASPKIRDNQDSRNLTEKDSLMEEYRAHRARVQKAALPPGAIPDLGPMEFGAKLVPIPHGADPAIIVKAMTLVWSAPDYATVQGLVRWSGYLVPTDPADFEATFKAMPGAKAMWKLGGRYVVAWVEVKPEKVMRLELPTLPGAPHALVTPKVKVLSGTELDLEAGPPVNVDGHVRVEPGTGGREICVDLFDSTIKDHDAAHIESDCFPNTDEGRRQANEFLADHGIGPVSFPSGPPPPPAPPGPEDFGSISPGTPRPPRPGGGAPPSPALGRGRIEKRVLRDVIDLARVPVTGGRETGAAHAEIDADGWQIRSVSADQTTAASVILPREAWIRYDFGKAEALLRLEDLRDFLKGAKPTTDALDVTVYADGSVSLTVPLDGELTRTFRWPAGRDKPLAVQIPDLEVIGAYQVDARQLRRWSKGLTGDPVGILALPTGAILLQLEDGEATSEFQLPGRLEHRLFTGMQFVDPARLSSILSAIPEKASLELRPGVRGIVITADLSAATGRGPTVHWTISLAAYQIEKEQSDAYLAAAKAEAAKRGLTPAPARAGKDWPTPTVRVDVPPPSPPKAAVPAEIRDTLLAEAAKEREDLDAVFAECARLVEGSDVSMELAEELADCFQDAFKARGYSEPQAQTMAAVLLQDLMQGKRTVPGVASDARQEGRDAFARGDTRVPPRPLTPDGMREWLRGWDEANLAAPVPEAAKAPEPPPPSAAPAFRPPRKDLAELNKSDLIFRVVFGLRREVDAGVVDEPYLEEVARVWREVHRGEVHRNRLFTTTLPHAPFAGLTEMRNEPGYRWIEEYVRRAVVGIRRVPEGEPLAGQLMRRTEGIPIDAILAASAYIEEVDLWSPREGGVLRWKSATRRPATREVLQEELDKWGTSLGFVIVGDVKKALEAPPAPAAPEAAQFDEVITRAAEVSLRVGGVPEADIPALRETASVRVIARLRADAEKGRVEPLASYVHLVQTVAKTLAFERMRRPIQKPGAPGAPPSRAPGRGRPKLADEEREFRRSVRATSEGGLHASLERGTFEGRPLTAAQRDFVRGEVGRRRERRERALTPQEIELMARLPSLLRRQVQEILETGEYQGARLRQDLLARIEQLAQDMGMIQRLEGGRKAPAAPLVPPPPEGLEPREEPEPEPEERLRDLEARDETREAEAPRVIEPPPAAPRITPEQLEKEVESVRRAFARRPQPLTDQEIVEQVVGIWGRDPADVQEALARSRGAAPAR